jgi:energy-coupling factor transporter ATP-binding protein EcfA2
MLSEQDLVQHTLLLGATGSGKTTLLTHMQRQIIAHRSNEPEHKPGILILDPKMEALSGVRAAAQAAGRESDLVVLGPEGDARLDLFGDLATLGDVETVLQRVLLGTPPVGGDNPYWQSATAALISAALTLLVVSNPGVTFRSAGDFLRSWLLSAKIETPKAVEEAVVRAKRWIKAHGARSPRPEDQQLLAAIDQVELWRQLDGRTRSNLQSCAVNVLRPLLSASAVQCFGTTSRATFNPARAVEEGLIVVVAINAVRQPDLARFLFRLARQAFFDGVQRRTGNPGSESRLCVLVADEFPLIVNRQDQEQLATIRSRLCGVIAAAQGLGPIDDQIGERARRAVIQHFNTVFFFRNLEEETNRFASVLLGTRKERRRSGNDPQGEGVWLAFLPRDSSAHYNQVPICTPGGLSRLPPHQAFGIFADGSRTEHPLWFQPHFEATSVEPPISSSVQVVARFCDDPDHLISALSMLGHPARWTAEVVHLVAGLYPPKQPRVHQQIRSFFGRHGIKVPQKFDQFPRSWLMGLPRILRRFCRIPGTRSRFIIDSIWVEDGVLLMSFPQEQTAEPNHVLDEIRAGVNLALYPNRFRPLAPKHRARLLSDFPDLRSQLAPWPDID